MKKSSALLTVILLLSVIFSACEKEEPASSSANIVTAPASHKGGEEEVSEAVEEEEPDTGASKEPKELPDTEEGVVIPGYNLEIIDYRVETKMPVINGLGEELAEIINADIVELYHQYYYTFEIFDRVDMYIDYELFYNTSLGYLSIYFILVTYTGGMHPNNYVDALVYDIENISRVSLGDCFSNPNWKEELQRELDIVANANDVIMWHIEDGEDLDFERAKFYFTEDALHICFSRGNAGPMSEGIIDLAIEFGKYEEIG